MDNAGGKKEIQKQKRWGIGMKRATKVMLDETAACGSRKGKGIAGEAPDCSRLEIADEEPDYCRPSTPVDSDVDDRYEDDEGFPEMNKKGEGLKMQVSCTPRPDFAELQCEHLGGPVWQILTGIQARTKFTNSELRHEGMGRSHALLMLRC